MNLVSIVDVNYEDIVDGTLYLKRGKKSPLHVGINKIQISDRFWKKHLPFNTKYIIEMAHMHPEATVTYLNYEDSESKSWAKIKNIVVEVAQ